jgi:proteasome accessory factor C
VRKQLRRDVAALARAGVRVEVEGRPSGRRYRLPPSGFSPAEIDLTEEERAVLVGALRALRRDFPYAGPLRLAIANLIGAASAGDGLRGAEQAADRATLAAVATSNDESVANRLATLETAVARRKRVRFDYYSISRDEASEREVEPYALSLLEGVWYVTGWDLRRDALRRFRLSRIQGRVTFATRHERGDYAIPEDFEPRSAGPSTPWQLGEPDKVALMRISDAASTVTRERYPWAVSIERPDEGTQRLLRTRYSGERQLAGWVLSLGEEALALSPQPLVERVTEGLERLVAAHGTTEDEGRSA